MTDAHEADSYGIPATADNVLSLDQHKRNRKKKEYTEKVAYPYSTAAIAAIDYLKERIDDEDLSRIVRRHIRLLMRLYDYYYGQVLTNRKSKAVSKLRLLPLFDAHHKSNDGYVADLSPIIDTSDPDFKPNGQRGSVLLTKEDKKDLIKLQGFYNLPSEGYAVIHVVFVAVTMIRNREEHHLYHHFDFPISEETEDGTKRHICGH
ncbi:MAG: hypothetical protein JAY74_08775 [Candidatus Thiodiazotropha taylori]|nr:hypothetical protein [Candidatus Thiodiazotropha taylori]